MKKVVLIFLLLFVTNSIYSQETYTINGETLELKTATKGTLGLLWASENGNYRFFIRTQENTYVELKEDDYKTILKELTNDTDVSLHRVKYTKRSFKNFISFYNYKKSIETEDGNKTYPVNFRLGFSGGVTNNPFIINPENSTSLLAGAELELYGDTDSPRHSGFLQARHSFSSDEFEFSTTEFSLGYRYRVIKKSKFNLYIQTKFATYNFRDNLLPEDINGIVELTNIKENEFDIPLIFGVGADFKVSKNGYITFIYGELFGLNRDNNGNFSTDISLSLIHI